jgi:hypothetical protein
MPTWLKVLLIVGGIFVVLVVGVAVAGVIVVRRYAPGLVEAGKQTITEGQEYGRRTDNEGCLNEAVARHSRSEGFTDIIRNTIFMRACLDASRPTPGFCDDVPRRFEFVKSAEWQLQQCKRYGLSPEKQCAQLFQQVQQFCEERGHRMSPGGNSNSGDSNGDDETSPPPAPMPRHNSNAR